MDVQTLCYRYRFINPSISSYTYTEQENHTLSHTSSSYATIRRHIYHFVNEKYMAFIFRPSVGLQTTSQRLRLMAPATICRTHISFRAPPLQQMTPWRTLTSIPELQNIMQPQSGPSRYFCRRPEISPPVLDTISRRFARHVWLGRSYTSESASGGKALGGHSAVTSRLYSGGGNWRDHYEPLWCWKDTAADLLCIAVCWWIACLFTDVKPEGVEENNNGSAVFKPFDQDMEVSSSFIMMI